MATEILKFVENNWGKEMGCSHCNNQISSYCGSCKSSFYCGASCQKSHWIGTHQYECVGGKKREGQSDEEEEEENKPKSSASKKHALSYNEPELTEVNWEDLYGDLWRKIASFLKAEDIQNLSLVQRQLQRHLRALFLSRFRFKVTSEIARDKHFLSILKEIQNVEVRNVKVLNTLIEHGAPIIDVKFRDGFDDPDFSIKQLTQIQHLTFGEDFATKLDVNNLPDNLLSLDLSRSYWNHEVNNLPTSITVLKLGKYFNYPLQNLPPGLEYLLVGQNFDSDVQPLPETLKKLVLFCPFRLFANRIPANLKELYLSLAQIDVPLNNLPSMLESLVIESLDFNDDFNFTYLTRLKRLSINNARFNQPLDGKLPESLLELELGFGFKQSVDRLPGGLLKLTLGHGFRKSIDNLPRTLTYLKVHYAVKIPAWISQKKNQDKIELIREK